MAKDALALLEHLGWRRVHVVGFSMGSQIAAKLASSVAPDHTQSLVMIGAAAGGVLSLPRSFHALRHSLRAITARTLIARARADLRLHFTKATLHSASSVSSSSSSFSAAAAAAVASGEGLMGFPIPPSLASVSTRSDATTSSSSAYTLPSAHSTSPSPPKQPRGSWGGGVPSSPAVGRRQKEDLLEEYVAHAQCTPPQSKHVSRWWGGGGVGGSCVCVCVCVHGVHGAHAWVHWAHGCMGRMGAWGVWVHGKVQSLLSSHDTPTKYLKRPPPP